MSSRAASSSEASSSTYGRRMSTLPRSSLQILPSRRTQPRASTKNESTNQLYYEYLEEPKIGSMRSNAELKQIKNQTYKALYPSQMIHLTVLVKVIDWMAEKPFYRYVMEYTGEDKDALFYRLYFLSMFNIGPSPDKVGEFPVTLPSAMQRSALEKTEVRETYIRFSTVMNKVRTGTATSEDVNKLKLSYYKFLGLRRDIKYNAITLYNFGAELGLGPDSDEGKVILSYLKDPVEVIYKNVYVDLGKAATIIRYRNQFLNELDGIGDLMDAEYKELGFEWDNYYAYTNPNHPLMMALRGKIQLTPQMFELGSPPWSLTYQDRLRHGINNYKNKEFYSVDGMFNTPYNGWLSWRKTDLMQAIVDAGLSKSDHEELRPVAKRAFDYYRTKRTLDSRMVNENKTYKSSKDVLKFKLNSLREARKIYPNTEEFKEIRNEISRFKSEIRRSITDLKTAHEKKGEEYKTFEDELREQGSPRKWPEMIQVRKALKYDSPLALELISNNPSHKNVTLPGFGVFIEQYDTDKLLKVLWKNVVDELIIRFQIKEEDQEEFTRFVKLYDKTVREARRSSLRDLLGYYGMFDDSESKDILAARLTRLTYNKLLSMDYITDMSLKEYYSTHFRDIYADPGYEIINDDQYIGDIRLKPYYLALYRNLYQTLKYQDFRSFCSRELYSLGYVRHAANTQFGLPLESIRKMSKAELCGFLAKKVENQAGITQELQSSSSQDIIRSARSTWVMDSLGGIKLYKKVEGGLVPYPESVIPPDVDAYIAACRNPDASGKGMLLKIAERLNLREELPSNLSLVTSSQICNLINKTLEKRRQLQITVPQTAVGVLPKDVAKVKSMCLSSEDNMEEIMIEIWKLGIMDKVKYPVTKESLCSVVTKYIELLRI